MKGVYIVIIIIVLGIAWWLFGSTKQIFPEPTAQVPATQEGASADAVDELGTIIDIKGKNFEFDMAEIRVQEGDVVTINITSTDGYHDWVVDEFGAETAKVNTGETASVTFVADKAGEYEYYCSVGQHRANGMVGKLIVE